MLPSGPLGHLLFLCYRHAMMTVISSSWGSPRGAKNLLEEGELPRVCWGEVPAAEGPSAAPFPPPGPGLHFSSRAASAWGKLQHALSTALARHVVNTCLKLVLSLSLSLYHLPGPFVSPSERSVILQFTALKPSRTMQVYRIAAEHRLCPWFTWM